jgi:uncharacterized protein VirK/YbjX
MNLVKKLSNPMRSPDPLYFLKHKYYLSKHFTLRQRVQSAMLHHEHEMQNYSSEYARRVYRSDGVLLWDLCVNNHSFTIVLIATDDNLHEGELSVILAVDRMRLCRMSFCYINENVFGLAPKKTMLISRNQTDRIQLRNLFDKTFKYNSPQLFCLSAICGIAMANKFDTVLAIRHDAQIAHDTTFESGMRNSYTALWEKFDAVEVDRHVYKLNAPLKLRPLHVVDATHRARARRRRKVWDDNAQSARSGMIRYRIGHAKFETTALYTRVAPNTMRNPSICECKMVSISDRRSLPGHCCRAQ